MDRCVIYARVSTDEQVLKYGIPAQLRACREYAKAHGYKVSEEISDEGITGATMDRPGLDKIRRLVAQRAVDVVLSLDADRISRDLSHLLIIKPEIDRNARMEFVAAKFEDSASGRMFFSVRGVISQYERDLLRERTVRGRREKARQGFVVCGRIPFGYDYIGKDEGERGRYAINEDQSATVRQIFEWADGGVSIRGIVRRLNEAGISPCMSAKWAKSSVARILGAELYVGVGRYNRHKRTGTLLKVRPEAEWITLTVPSIIDRSLWERVAARLSDNRRSLAGRPTRRYALRGILRCSCGARMFGNPNHGTPYYRCGSGCRSVAAEKIDARVWQALSRPFADLRVLRALIEKHLDALNTPKSGAQRAKLAAQIDRLKAKEFRATRALLDSDLIESYDVIKGQLAEVRDQRKRAEAELAAMEPTRGAWLSVERMAAEIARALPKFDEARRQEFMKRVVDHVEFDGSEIVIHCFFIAQYCPDHQQVVVNIEQRRTYRISFVIKEKVA